MLWRGKVYSRESETGRKTLEAEDLAVVIIHAKFESITFNVKK